MKLIVKGELISLRRQGISWLTKTLLIMKLTALLILVVCLESSANIHAQKVTLSFKDTPLKIVFKEIRQQTGYDFFYEDDHIDLSVKVNGEFKNAPVDLVLAHCLGKSGITYAIAGKTIVIRRVKAGSGTDPAGNDIPLLINIKGRVMNENNEPVAGATITVKGTNKLTSTTNEGDFSLEGIEANATLVITGVNIERQEVKLNGESSLVIKVVIRVVENEGITIVSNGYQQVSKERTVGSFAKLDSSSYHRRAGMGILERLDGNITGALFTKKGGPAPLQIRGISTLNIGSTSPLVILDNFPFKGDLNAINPNDVVDITVLKDAAAASIWGSLAGNGVIVITTRKGKFNQPFQVSASVNASVQEKPDLNYYPAISSAEFIEVEKYLFNKGFYTNALADNINRPVVSPVAEILDRLNKNLIDQDQANALINELKTRDVKDNLNEHYYKKATGQQYHINLSGGSQTANYIISTGYNRSTPFIQRAKDNEQLTISSHTTLSPTKRLKIEAGINFSKRIDKSLMPDLGLLYPYSELINDQGEVQAILKDYRQSYLDTAGQGKLLNWNYSPIDEVSNSDRANKNQLILFNIGSSYQIRSWLKADLKYQYSQSSGSIRNHQSQETYFTRNLINLLTKINGGAVEHIIPLGGILDLSSSQAISHYARGQLNINRTWHKHSLNAIIAGEFADQESESNGSRFYGYNEDIGTYATGLNYKDYFPTYLRPNSLMKIPENMEVTERSINRSVSLLTNMTYTFSNLYNLYISARRDGANVFGVRTNNKWKPLWSIGGSWDISNERFYSIQWLPSIRLRASFGYMGNTTGGSGLPTIRYTFDRAPYTNYIMANVGDAPNPDLRWEQIRTLNIGTDFSALNGRITGSLEWFDKKSTDLVSPVPFDPTSGVSTYTVNSASLKANGMEVNLNTKNINGALLWESRLGWSYVKTVVTKVYSGNFRAIDFVSFGIQPSEGRIAWGLASYRWGGLQAETGNPNGYIGKQISQDYTAIFNDSVDNQVFHGSSIPLHFGYLSNTFTWKGISISANITYSFDYYFRKPSIDYGTLLNGRVGHSDYLLRWQKPGDEKLTSIPSMIYPLNGNRDRFYTNAAINVSKGDHIRWQDARIQYSFSQNVLRRISIKGLRAFLYVSNINLIIWRANKFKLDPDFRGGTSILEAPTPRSYTAGISINL